MGASSDYAVYKKISGVLKELGNEKGELSKIKSTEFVVKDLHKKSFIELKELLQRQKSILKNKSFVTKLPDKGEKLRSRCKEIEVALDQLIFKTGHNNGCDETKEASVTCDTSAMNAFEWTKKIECTKNTEVVAADLGLCNTDEVEDPLELLATHSFDAPPSQKTLRNEDNDDPALSIANELSQLEIKDKDIIPNATEPHSGSNDPESTFEFSIRLLQNLALKEKMNPVRKQFKPFKPLKNSLSEMKTNKISSVNSKKSSLWTESSATGLFYSNSHDAKLIPLQESLRLLGESQKKERDQIYKFTEQSLAQFPKTEIGLPSSVGLHYRDSNTSSHVLDDSEDEDEFLNAPFEEEAGSEND